MDYLIDVINDLHDAFTNVKMNIKLNLPQIAVVGSQSSGKSSVLEAIVGKDFLPRGSGIVTRCPLVLQLVQLDKSNTEEWGEFLHKPGKKFFNFPEINEEIQNRTVELAGKSGITEKAINLKVYSSHVLNLTLVDLPGLVMNAVGDQPKDIDRQIKDMVTRYVAPDNTIILAISPANTDLATSASLRLAKQLDPEGVRTVGVLTKLDLMDRGTDALEILNGNVINLRHGFIGVVNRSQHDINNAKDMYAAREDERAFFEGHPAYSSIAEKQGTAYLAKRLNQLLLEHIKKVIPELKSYVDKLLDNTRKQMEKLGMLNQQNIDPSANMLSLIKSFSDALNHTIDGGLTDASKELLGGARLDYIFHECFACYVNSLSSLKDLTDEYIHINSRNMAGMHASLFPSDQVFITLAKQQIKRLEDPSLKCVHFVHEELLRIVEICSEKLDRFPKLRQAVISLCQKSLEEYRRPTRLHVQTIISAECGFINVKHPMMETLIQRSFLNIFGGNDEKEQTQQGEGKEKGKKSNAESGGGQGEKSGASHAAKMGNVPSKITLGNQMSVHERHVYDTIRDMVEGYFSIVKANVADQVPKAITLLMITKLREEVYAKLVQEFYSTKSMENFLAEAPEVETQRKATRAMMEALTKAQVALDKVCDLSIDSAS